jgi:hypothetical protein
MYVPTYRNLSLDSPKEEFLRKFPRTTVECWICLHYGIYYLTWKVCIKLEEVLNGGYVYPIAVSGGILSDLESLYQFGRGNKYYSLLSLQVLPYSPMSDGRSARTYPSQVLL